MTRPLIPDAEVRRIFNETEINGMTKKQFLDLFFILPKSRPGEHYLSRLENLGLLLSEDDNGLLYKVKNDDNS